MPEIGSLGPAPLEWLGSRRNHPFRLAVQICSGYVCSLTSIWTWKWSWKLGLHLCQRTSTFTWNYLVEMNVVVFRILRGSIIPFPANMFILHQAKLLQIPDILFVGLFCKGTVILNECSAIPLKWLGTNVILHPTSKLQLSWTKHKTTL